MIGTLQILAFAFIIAVVALVFIVRGWKEYGKSHIQIEVVRGGGSDSVTVFGKLAGNMLVIEPSKKYGFTVGKLYPFVADEEIELRPATVDDLSETIRLTKKKKNEDDEEEYEEITKPKTPKVGLSIVSRTAIYPTQYPAGLPSIFQVPIRKCVVDEDTWEMRTRHGSDPMMNPDLLVLYEHEKTMGLLVVLSQTIQEYEEKLQKALARTTSPMVMYILVGLTVIGVGYILYQITPLTTLLNGVSSQLDEALSYIRSVFQ